MVNFTKYLEKMRIKDIKFEEFLDECARTFDLDNEGKTRLRIWAKEQGVQTERTHMQALNVWFNAMLLANKLEEKSNREKREMVRSNVENFKKYVFSGTCFFDNNNNNYKESIFEKIYRCKNPSNYRKNSRDFWNEKIKILALTVCGKQKNKQRRNCTPIDSKKGDKKMDTVSDFIRKHKCKNCYWYFETDERSGLCEREPLHVAKSCDSKCQYFYSYTLGSFKEEVEEKYQ